MDINFNDLFASLEIMWKGMLGLFMVCGFTMLLTMFISKFITGKKKSD
jgi:hypothetical protein